MLSTALVLALSLAQHPGALRPGKTTCQEFQRIELSRMTQNIPEICVSPHLLTGFHFDVPVLVDLQEEVRFEAVARSRTSIQILPPKDMIPGERLRLSISYPDGASKNEVVLLLVYSEEQATRQVEVFRDQRSRESLDAELRQEYAKNQRLQGQLSQLRQELDALRERVEDPPQLVGLVLGLRGNDGGYRLKKVDFSIMDRSDNGPGVIEARIFRMASRAAFELRVGSNNTEPWQGLEATVWDARGQHVRVVHVQQEMHLSETRTRLVIVEIVVAKDWPHGQVYLRLQDATSQGVTVTGMKLP